MSRRRRPSRRDLLRAAPIAGAGAAALAVGAVARAPRPARTTTGRCRFCLLHCDLAGQVSGSTLLRVDGDTGGETRGFLCHHGRALPGVVHSPERLRRPLLRRRDRLVETSWDEALGFIGERMEAVRARFGPEAVAFQTGWPLVRHPLMDWIRRLARAWGTPNVASVASLCETSGRMGQALTVGSKYRHDFRRTRTLVIWGSNPTHSTPLLAHVVARKATEGRLVVVDPVRTELAAVSTEHLAVRPGTDGALALGLIHLLIAEGLVDRPLIDRETVGFEALAGLAASWPPARTAAITGVSPSRSSAPHDSSPPRHRPASGPAWGWSTTRTASRRCGPSPRSRRCAAGRTSRRSARTSPRCAPWTRPARCLPCPGSPHPSPSRHRCAPGPSAPRNIQYSRCSTTRRRECCSPGPSSRTGPIRCGRWCSLPPTRW